MIPTDALTFGSMPPVHPASDRDASMRGHRFWELAFAGVLVVTCVVVTFSETDAPSRAGAVGLLLGQVPTYLLVGRSGFLKGASGARRWTYLALVMVLFAPATALVPMAAVALFAITPMCYLMVHPVAASGVVLAANVVPAMTVVYDEAVPRTDVVISTAVIAAGVLVSLAFGMWIRRVIEQSRERAMLIRRLDETRTELARMSRHAGALEERRHLAREIHDTLAQGFTSIVMLLQAASADPSRMDHFVRLALRSAQDNLDDARALVSGSLDVVRLPEALRRLADRFGEELDVVTEFSMLGEERQLVPAVEVALLRVAQEAVANVRKHAEATAVTVTLRFTEDAVGLSVRDDGVGFDPSMAGGGHGLPGMRDRIGGLGGRVDLVSAPGTGTTVSVEVSA